MQLIGAGRVEVRLDGGAGQRGGECNTLSYWWMTTVLSSLIGAGREEVRLAGGAGQ
jgi:hypothetical protein